VTSATPRADLRFTGVVAIRPLVEKGQGRVAEVPPKFARVGGSRPDFGPEKAKKHKKTLIKSKLNQN
jgi:hypothetical protein